MTKKFVELKPEDLQSVSGGTKYVSLSSASVAMSTVQSMVAKPTAPSASIKP